MQDKDQKLIWESYVTEGTDGETSDLTPREKMKLAALAAQKGKGPLAVKEEENTEQRDTDYERMPVDELKQLSPEEAKNAIGKLNQIDIAIQKGTDRMYSSRENEQRSNIAGRKNILQNIITPPPPPETEEEAEARRTERKARIDSFKNRRSMLQPTKRQFRETGVFEEIAKELPEWVLNNRRFLGIKQPGDGNIPANLQRMIVMDFLEDGELPDIDSVNLMIDHLVTFNELDGPPEG